MQTLTTVSCVSIVTVVVGYLYAKVIKEKLDDTARIATSESSNILEEIDFFNWKARNNRKVVNAFISVRTVSIIRLINSKMSQVYEVCVSDTKPAIKKLRSVNGSKYLPIPKTELEKMQKSEYLEVSYEASSNVMKIVVRPHRV